LQHIDKLYEAVKTNRHESQAKDDALFQRVNLLQAAVDRLTAFMEKVLRQAKRNSPGAPPKA